MASEVEAHLKQLAFFSEANLPLKKAILKKCEREFIDAIAEICGSYLLGNIKCDKKQFRELATHKKCLRKIVNVTRLAANRKQKTKSDSRRQILLQKGSGFWVALLPVVSELTSYFISKALER